ncbi:MAG: hypothetical protein NTX50_05855 [Candidatus Sumerlaeota bacterium]|nr:hypothetical protein [Candidatus Sumerlaeota bacterium]
MDKTKITGETPIDGCDCFDARMAKSLAGHRIATVGQFLSCATKNSRSSPSPLC